MAENSRQKISDEEAVPGDCRMPAYMLPASEWGFSALMHANRVACMVPFVLGKLHFNLCGSHFHLTHGAD
jgi:hypothetical protein